MIQDPEEINYLLGQIDPYNNNKMTYSEIVQLLSSHMVPSDDPNMPPGQSIPMLEKLSLVNCDKQLETESNTINTTN